MPWLMATMPVSSRSATLIERDSPCVNAYATRPYSVSLAIAMASSSVAKVAIGATGPNTSSWLMRASAGTSLSTVGS